MKSNLYNPDGTLSLEVQSLISPKPTDMSMKEWKNKMKLFKISLSEEELVEFKRLRTNHTNSVYYDRHHRKKARSQQKDQATKKARSQQKDQDTKQEKARKYAALYYALHSKEINKLTTQRQNRRYKEDPLYRLKKVMRTQCHKTVKCLALGKKPLQTFEWVGCSPEELKAHLESLFTEGMSWENYGEWHADHIRPISSFSLTEWKQVNHYTNLQPLWAEDNLKKGDKWEVDLSAKNLDGMQTVEGVESSAPGTTQDEREVKLFQGLLLESALL